MLILKYLLTILVAYLSGKFIQEKLKFPSILGWLFTGAILGPNLLNVFSSDVMESFWFVYFAIGAQLLIGAMVGVNLRWQQLKDTGSDILKLTLSQMSGSFVVVFIVAAIICTILDIPILIALLFANISIALAPGPVLGIMNQYKTSGPLTKIMTPVACTDSVLASLIFFTIISIIQAKVLGGEFSLFMTLTYMMFIPIMMGVVLGGISSKFVREKNSPETNRIISVALFTAAGVIAYLINNYIYPEPRMNYILLGMGFVGAIVNFVNEDLAKQLKVNWGPVVNAGLLVLIVNSSAPIDVKIISSVGWVSAIYVGARAAGRIGGNFVGCKMIKAPQLVGKYGGMLGLPHSGVSLVFASLSVGVATAVAPKAAEVLAISLPLAALVNEVIALILAKKVYEWAGEISTSEKSEAIVKPVLD